jgi:hypothetical protein
MRLATDPHRPTQETRNEKRKEVIAMDKAIKRKKELKDLPVEAEQAADVKGGGTETAPDSSDAKIQKKWLPAN